ncbi:MAG: hypothetical protein ACI9JN_001273 [Bacteroidia bacterium]|jgi:hypothetical protein
MTPEQQKAKEIYDSMKGFRITNAHRKKCARLAIQRTIDVLMSLFDESLTDLERATIAVQLNNEIKIREELEKL